MSRVGKLPIEIPSGVTVDIRDMVVTVKGSKGELKQAYNSEVTVEAKDGTIVVNPRDKADNRSRAMWGLYRALIANLVKGVSEGFTKNLEIQGVGFKAAADNQFLNLSLGYSHEIKYAIPEGIQVKCEKPTLVSISGINKELVGQVAAEIRALRKPEPYKGKGVRYEGEFVRHKEGKKK